jgi:uncharacterized protein (TIGR02453 family)
MISNAYSTFFAELSANNEVAWMHANKKRYEQVAKEPFLALVAKLIPHLQKFEPAISNHPKDALFRLNRDIRFSADKSPYNTILKAGFSAGGKKTEKPGFYLGIDAETIHIGGGLFNLQPATVLAVRAHIYKNQSAYTKIVHDTHFVKTFGDILGEKAKRLDEQSQLILADIPSVANKQFYAMTRLPLADFYDDENIVEKLLPYFKQVSALNAFLGAVV